MNQEMYICENCRAEHRFSRVSLNRNWRCEICNSDQVISEEVILAKRRFAEQKKAKKLTLIFDGRSI